jgi:uncharacterized 2Fe-2S/4Fe-4S cluster protein (DUF4445 family)
MSFVWFVREKLRAEVPEGTTVLEAQRIAGLVPDAPCGGAGKCGKCLVRIHGELVKACQKVVHEDLEVETLTAAGQKYEILTEGVAGQTGYQPDLRMHQIRLEQAKPGDARSDWEQLLEALEDAGGLEDLHTVRPDPALASSLYEKRRASEEWYVIHTQQEILEMRTKPGRCCFAAFDIGTTTVAGYLLDAADGQTLAVESSLNPQTQYGADVIQRADYAQAHGIDAPSGCIRQKINEMLTELAARAGVDVKDIFQVSIVGNTCMHHLFLGISPASLTHAPYSASIRQRLTLSAGDYGIRIHPNGQLLMLPVIASHVGADTCGCLLATAQDRKEEISLMLDIGTNGEMVLGNRERLVTCSTAAGPALEGAKIECGMRGAAGAVDHVRLQDGRWTYTTIQGAPPVGLCGSGLIDLVAQLHLAGMIDESGRLESGQENPHVFVLAEPEVSGNGRGVYLTQKDIGEVQLAKAAIAAGIRILMKKLSITEDEIARVYLAGAFGNYMDPASAGVIGLLPGHLSERIVPVGNAAGEGAKMALLNHQELERTDMLVRRIEFVELAADPEFQDCFVDELELA